MIMSKSEQLISDIKFKLKSGMFRDDTGRIVINGFAHHVSGLENNLHLLDVIMYADRNRASVSPSQIVSSIVVNTFIHQETDGITMVIGKINMDKVPKSIKSEVILSSGGFIDEIAQNLKSHGALDILLVAITRREIRLEVISDDEDMTIKSATYDNYNTLGQMFDSVSTLLFKGLGEQILSQSDMESLSKDVAASVLSKFTLKN